MKQIQEETFRGKPMGPSQEASSTYDELSMQQSLLFSDGLKDLKNLRSQLYAAAEYFESSYFSNNDQKQSVVATLKQYAVSALVNTIDHLGSVSYKVNGLLDEKIDEFSVTELRVSCIEQRLRTYRGYIDHGGLSQQSQVISTPKYHKRYILPIGEKIMPESGKHAVPQPHIINPSKKDTKSQHFPNAATRSTMADRTPSFRKLRSPSPSQRVRSSSPSRKARSPSPSTRTGKFFFSEKRSDSPLPASNLNPLIRSGSLSSRLPLLQNSSNKVQQFPTEPQKSNSMRLHAEREEEGDVEQDKGKTKRFLKSLLSRRKSRKDDKLFTYLDEY